MRNHNTVAFTLVEVMISVVIIGAMMTMAMTGGVDLYKKYTMERGYKNMHSDVRRSIALINRDLRYASGITGYSPSNITFSVVSTNNATSINKVIQYKLEPIFVSGRTNNMLIRNEWLGNAAGVVNSSVTPNSRMTLTLSNHSVRSPDEFFSCYLKPGQKCTTNNFANAAEVRCYLELENRVLANITTDRIQVRVQLRNK